MRSVVSGLASGNFFPVLVNIEDYTIILLLRASLKRMKSNVEKIIIWKNTAYIETVFIKTNVALNITRICYPKVVNSEQKEGHFYRSLIKLTKPIKRFYLKHINIAISTNFRLLALLGRLLNSPRSRRRPLFFFYVQLYAHLFKHENDESL